MRIRGIPPENYATSFATTAGHQTVSSRWGENVILYMVDAFIEVGDNFENFDTCEELGEDERRRTISVAYLQLKIKYILQKVRRLRF